MLWNDQVLRPNDVGAVEHSSGGFERVLITGSVRGPNSIGELVIDGGFVLGPFGGPVHQRLLKREKQGGDWFDTDLEEKFSDRWMLESLRPVL